MVVPFFITGLQDENEVRAHGERKSSAMHHGND